MPVLKIWRPSGNASKIAVRDTNDTETVIIKEAVSKKGSLSVNRYASIVNYAPTHRNGSPEEAAQIFYPNARNESH